MTIITSINKLTNLSKEENDFLNKSKASDLVVLVDSDMIPLEVTKALCGFGNKINFIEQADDFSLGYAVGIICGKSSGKNQVVILLDKEVVIDNPNVTVGIGKARKPSAKNKPADLSSTTDVKRRVRKTEQPVIDEPLPIPAPVSKDAVRDRLLKSDNNLLRSIASDDKKYAMLVSAVKDSSDPDIGFGVLLDVNFGREVKEAIISDVKPYYKKIKEEG